MRTHTWVRHAEYSIETEIDVPNLSIGFLPGRVMPALYESDHGFRVLAWFVDEEAAMRAQVLLGVLAGAPVPKAVKPENGKGEA